MASRGGTSLVYRSAGLYELIMLALYGRHYPARYRALAELVPEGASVLDVCCGPGVLYERYLRARGVDYTGLDLNPGFAHRVTRFGGRGLVWDVHGPEPLPAADIVIMQASLYQFLPEPRPVVERLLAAARERVIVAEPVRNLAQSRLRWLARLAQRQTNAGQGAPALRFDEPKLDALFASMSLQPSLACLIPGGREKVYVFDPRPNPRAAAVAAGCQTA